MKYGDGELVRVKETGLATIVMSSTDSPEGDLYSVKVNGELVHLYEHELMAF